LGNFVFKIERESCSGKHEVIRLIIILYYVKAAVHLQYTIQSLKSYKMSTYNCTQIRMYYNLSVIESTNTAITGGWSELRMNCVSGCSRHETEPTVLVIIDRRHGSWSSVKSILHAIGVRLFSIYSASVSLVISLI